MGTGELDGYIQLATVLYALGRATADSIKDLVHVHHPEATEAELNTIVDGAQQKLRDVKAQADADAGGVEGAEP
jgi:hypothetical protein